MSSGRATKHIVESVLPLAKGHFVKWDIVRLPRTCIGDERIHAPEALQHLSKNLPDLAFLREIRLDADRILGF